MSREPASDPETELRLLRDQQLYGASYYRVVDGVKVRVDPSNVIVTRDGFLCDRQGDSVEEELAK